MLNETPDAPPSSNDRFGELLDLVRLLSDPVATNTRVSDLQAATETARVAVSAAQEAQAAAAQDRAQADAHIADAKKASDKKLRDDRRDFEQEISAAKSMVAVRELAVGRAETYLKSRTAEVEKMHTDLTARLDALKRAAGAASS